MKWNDNDKQQLKELYRTNLSAREIAQKMNRSHGSIVAKISSMGLGVSRYE